ncbi:hypothetical protein EKG37_17505 [Robertmurraya yapensis]|uniref:Uncharacterized protein n=3 Tax=Bacillaceae TaxID=186817 RepID=A0A3S0KD52_9BACI|nr:MULTISPECIES: hypothetical protein [Bacillaceae]RTR28100.1 hypothetical protein EKG37_17505 [Bacillus yapensis]TKC15183.1 hypothetical protein FA727_20085 [Robertmurraya kyonggiensis]TKS94342.1 hypothetical protein FAR12_17505 [Bacillus yapensis]
MSIWRTSQGVVPLLDDPTAKIEMFRWSRRPDLHLDVIQHRVQTGQISQLDLDIAVTLANAKLLTEKQLRFLYSKAMIGHKLGTRLRVLQQNGWLEGWKIKSDFHDTEYVWSIGIAAKNFLSFCLGITEVPNPMHMASAIKEQLFYPTLNEIRIQLLIKGLVQKEKFAFHPFLSNEIEPPHAVFQLDTPAGKMDFIVERLTQGQNPLRFMKKKQSYYRKYIAQHGSLPKVFNDSVQSVVVWSISTEEGIDQLVSSYPKYEQEFMQLFLVDELLDNLRHAWRVAKPIEEYKAEIQKFDMDFIKE